MASPVKEAVPTVPLHQPLSEGSAPPKGPSTSLTNDLGVVAGTAVWFRRHVGPSVSLASGGPSRPSRNRHSHHSALSHNQAAGLRCRVTDVPLWGRKYALDPDLEASPCGSSSHLEAEWKF